MTERPFAKQVRQELAWAKRNYPEMTSAHEAISIIREEFEEAWDEVTKKPKAFNPIRLRAELVQLAAMAQRAVEDLNL